MYLDLASTEQSICGFANLVGEDHCFGDSESHWPFLTLSLTRDNRDFQRHAIRNPIPTS